MFLEKRYGHRKRFVIPMVGLIALFLLMLACGSEVTPEKIDEVQPAGEEDGAEAQPAATDAPVSGGAEEPAPTEAGGFAASTDGEEEPEPTEAPATNELTVYEVGDVIEAGDWVMTVLGWSIVPGDDFNEPDEGNQFIAVDVILVNQSAQAQSVSSFVQMSLRDETGQVYDADFSAQIAIQNSSPDGEVSPGERIRGTVGFQVPEGASDLVFVYDVAAFGSGKVFINLGPEPIALDPPEEIAGEQELELFAVGDIIEVGDIVMLVSGWSVSAGSDFNEPEEGNQFLYVDVSLVNASDSVEAIIPFVQMTLRDETGQIYEPDFSAEIENIDQAPDGDLLPGERVRGWIGFQVPIEAAELTFVYDAELFGAGKLFVSLGSEPTVVELPLDLPGETAQVVHPAGEAVTIGDYEITVLGVEYIAGSQFSQPEPGRTFVVIDVSVKNISDASVQLSSALQMFLKDSLGQYYSVDFDALMAMDGTTPEGELVPGELIRGQVAFQVPENAELIFVFEDEVFEVSKLFVALPE